MMGIAIHEIKCNILNINRKVASSLICKLMKIMSADQNEF